MILSRGLIFLKLSNHVVRNQLFQKGKHELRKQIARGSHGGEYCYRKLPPANDNLAKLAAGLGAIFWWWIIWHLLTDYHELYGPVLPDPSSWTDEELGIPPDDED